MGRSADKLPQKHRVVSGEALSLQLEKLTDSTVAARGHPSLLRGTKEHHSIHHTISRDRKSSSKWCENSKMFTQGKINSDPPLANHRCELGVGHKPIWIILRLSGFQKKTEKSLFVS